MDIESLLLPISEKSNCGEYLCYDYVYDQLKELRREDDIQLSQGIWQTEPKRANWPELKKLCCELLKTKTKDLQIAMWLTESLIAENQFKGFNEGLKIIRGLCEKFWDEIYPEIDWENRSYAYRIAPFFFLADKISERIVLIPLTTQNDPIFYSLSDWMTARRNIQIKNHKGLSLKDIGKQVAATPIEIFQDTASQVNEAISHLDEITKFLDEKCPQDAPSFSLLLGYLNDIKRITEKNLELKEKQQVKKTVVQNAAPSEVQDEIVLEEEIANQEPTLNQAYNALDEIAVFLEQKQPQSPASTLVRVASQIGKKSFQELLALNMQSGVSVLNTISELYRIFYNKNESEGKD